MDRHEFSAFAAALRTFFPRCSVLPNEEAMSLWYTALRDLPYPVLSAALLRWVSTEKWPPTVAELRAMTAEIVVRGHARRTSLRLVKAAGGPSLPVAAGAGGCQAHRLGPDLRERESGHPPGAVQAGV